MKLRLNTFPLIAGCLLTGLSALKGADEKLDTRWKVQAGLVVAGNTSYYKGVGSEGWVLPLIIAEYKRFYIQGVEAGYRFYEGQNGQEFSIVTGVTFDGFDSTDSSFLSGMEDRDSAWEIGFSYKRIIGLGEMELRLMNDLGGTHEGYSFKMDYERLLWSDKKHSVNWYTGVEYWDEKKTDYYFGVRASEALTGRAAYSPSGQVSWFLGLNAIKQLNSHYALILSTEYRTSGDAVSDSPLVTRSDQLSGYIGIFKKF